MAGSHDLPSPTSPRRSRGFSLGGKSDRSHGSGRKSSLTETPEEKAKRTLHTKADPTLAMNEAQPADPDISNPTRPRYERPLETIRSFEAAIEGSYNNRRMSSLESNGGYSRPGSYYGMASIGKYSFRVEKLTWCCVIGGNANHNRYSDQGNYPYGRGSYSRPDSYVDNNYQGSQQYSPHYPYNQYRGQRPRQNGRMNSEYGYGGNAANFYPQQSYQRSNDNMTAGSGSNNTDQWGNSTDPSSVNSSMDRLQQQLQNGQKQESPQETYGFSGFGDSPQLDTSFQEHAAPKPPPHGGQNTYTNGANAYSQPPPPPSKNDTPESANNKGTLKKNGSEKRQSWFKKRFSRS
ncbi:hypothetical protein T310_0392 [Rasamsonia emersonii CBS 393.64]|uniref:Uncharacterized protein n=1 Tax=Rasamsonia emersonii (strain ATCC 16479 / CBS 393.64 / IMI 116815) TaxID=1408163 RepID=A0A0F4Z4Y9_RASE3|nr:hypothetical protein T310_0392 [Rasamsonia emersonii CBS 393.64]KKA25587.1 hypothetical protein T310_0392 [Rasamsonia emersonii CBS 393.64]